MLYGIPLLVNLVALLNMSLEAETLSSTKKAVRTFLYSHSFIQWPRKLLNAKCERVGGG